MPINPQRAPGGLISVAGKCPSVQNPGAQSESHTGAVAAVVVGARGQLMPIPPTGVIAPPPAGHVYCTCSHRRLSMHGATINTNKTVCTRQNGVGDNLCLKDPCAVDFRCKIVSSKKKRAPRCPHYKCNTRTTFYTHVKLYLNAWQCDTEHVHQLLLR